jgi:biotin synthase
MSTIMTNKVDKWLSLLERVERSIMAGGSLGFDEAMELTGLPEASVMDLAVIADKVRRRFNRPRADLCSIINARSGRCAEDCAFCAQSARYATSSPIHPMKSVGEIVEAAKEAEKNGAHRFCIVTSGGDLGDSDFDVTIAAVEEIGRKTGLKRCASLGGLSAERAERLKAAGLSRYHHNLETSPSFWPRICSTHTYDDRLATLEHLKEAGIERCVGGILNLGESARQRIEFAFELKKLEPESVPINFLSPRSGTPLAGRPLLSPIEAARYLALFRLILPRTSIRLAGGRLETFKDRPDLPFVAGANALLIGDLLTTKGPEVKSDLDLLRGLGFDLTAEDENSC